MLRMLAAGVRARKFTARTAVAFYRAVSFEPPTEDDRRWLRQVGERGGYR